MSDKKVNPVTLTEVIMTIHSMTEVSKYSKETREWVMPFLGELYDKGLITSSERWKLESVYRE